MPNDNSAGAGQPLWSAVSTGVIDVDNATEQLPDVTGGLVLLQADSGNSGQIYIVDADDKTTEGIRLNAGDATPWLPVTNLNVLFAYGSAVNQNLRYMVLH